MGEQYQTVIELYKHLSKVFYAVMANHKDFTNLSYACDVSPAE